jgi:hypothetical protein
MGLIMEKETLQESINRLKRFPGKVRGEIFLNHAEFIKEKEGKGGLKRLEEKLKDLDIPVNFKKINSLNWMSEGLSSSVILVAKDIFYFEEKNIFEMGRSAPRFSLGLKMLVKNVILPRRLFEESPVYWKNLFDFGFIDPVDFNEDLQQATLRIHEYKTHPLLCIYHAGYIKGLSEFILKSEEVTVEETKCVYRGDEYDEYKIKWD